MEEIHINVIGRDNPFVVTGEDIKSFNNAYEHWSTSNHATWMAFCYEDGFLELNMKNVVSINTKKSS